MLPIESLIHRYGIIYNAALEQGTEFVGKCVCVCVCVLVRRGCCALASTGCITNCTIQRQLASWSAENSLEKPQMKLHLRGNTLQGWAAIFQDAV